MRTYSLEKTGSLDGLILHERNRPLAGPYDLIIRVRAISLNKRDGSILNGTYPIIPKPGVIPISDGAGEVVAIGERVTRFTIGDHVAGNYFPRWRSGPLEWELFDQLGCTIDGVLTEYARLDEQWAVRVPDHLTWEEAATLPCAGVTAWNSICGPEPAIAGCTVLTLGTGGVSLFALQFAKMFGCRVIVTTSNDAKIDRLKALGADHVINYVNTPEWSKAVRDYTGGRGADLVVETVGPDTIDQSMRSVSLHGQVIVLISRNATRTSLEISSQAYVQTMATLRRVFVGSRDNFETMNRAIAVHQLRPVIDRVFPFEQAREALAYSMQGKQFGKVVIRGVEAE